MYTSILTEVHKRLQTQNEEEIACIMHNRRGLQKSTYIAHVSERYVHAVCEY